MAQKSNLLTVRTPYSSNLILYNTRIWFSLSTFFKNLIRLFFLKGVLVSDYLFNFDNNAVLINMFLYYQRYSVSRYKKIIFKKKLKLINKVVCKSNGVLNLFFFNRSLVYFLKKYIKAYGYNFYTFQIKTINFLIKKNQQSFLSYFYINIKKFSRSIFSRRYNLFVDFLKLSTLLFFEHIPVYTYLIFLSRIFKFLTKRLHNQYFYFIKTAFKLLIFPNGLKNFEKNIKGIKFLVSGRIRGKERASSRLLQVGSTPTQSLGKNIVFSSCHSYTLYGLFGFKIWVFLN
jgi:hypothetical protein